MRCPFCENDATKVVDKRDSDSGEVTRRRRECLKCQERFTTYERIETETITVIKRDSTREPFSREKILKGLNIACQKRHISAEVLDNLTTDIEKEIRLKGEKEVSTKRIGQLVMKKLKKLDNVAYIRFASVHRDFKDFDDFEKEMQKLR